MSGKAIMLSLATIAVMCSASMSNAADIKKLENGMVYVTGDLDVKDRSDLKDLLPGSSGLVIGRITFGRAPFSFLQSIASAISDSGVPTVCPGSCSGYQTYLWMAGKQRQIGVVPNNKVDSIMINAIINGGGGVWPGLYALYNSQLPEGMPRPLLSKYTSESRYPSVLIATVPTKNAPEGTIKECSDVKNAETCSVVEGLTTISTGIMTSAEIVQLPAL